MKTISLLTAVSLALVFSSCNKETIEPEEEQNTATTYALGQEHAGGIVIQLDATQQHGLVVAKVDQVTYADHINWSASKAMVELYDAGGTGWRLPTKTELELIYNNRSTFGLSGFDNRNYWSSNVGNGSAWSQYFGVPGWITTSPWKQLTNCTLCSRGVKEF